VIAVRTTERYSGRQTQLWEGVDDSVQFFVSNDLHGDPNESPCATTRVLLSKEPFAS
jgi:hypothetical protein